MFYIRVLVKVPKQFKESIFLYRGNLSTYMRRRELVCPGRDGDVRVEGIQ